MTLQVLRLPVPPRHPRDTNRRARVVIIGAVYILTGAMVAAAVTTAIRADTRPHRTPISAQAKTRQPQPGNLADTTERR